MPFYIYLIVDICVRSLSSPLLQCLLDNVVCVVLWSNRVQPSLVPVTPVSLAEITSLAALTTTDVSRLSSPPVRPRLLLLSSEPSLGWPGWEESERLPDKSVPTVRGVNVRPSAALWSHSPPQLLSLLNSKMTSPGVEGIQDLLDVRN